MAEPRAEPFSPRTVEIRPPSLRDETTIVVRLAVVIVAIVGFYLANTAWDAGRSTRTGGLLPYQTLVSDADGPAQRMFRALQEGLLEAERGRTALGGWPAIDTLAEQGIPPFASDPTARGPAYRWTLTRRGTFINYRGTPSAADAPAWLLHIQEPYPGAPPDPSPEDEEHHRLPGNFVLHVSVWTHADAAGLSPALVQVPQAEGWIQLRVNAPGPGYVPAPTVPAP